MQGDEHFAIIVGRRQRRELGKPPSAKDRAALARMAAYQTRAPKGVFIYTSHEAANEDRLRWTVDAIVSRHADD